MSLLIVELSPLLTRWRTRLGLSLTTSNSYLGLPQLWVRQPLGTPFCPTGVLDQPSTRTCVPCAAPAEVPPSSSTATIEPFRIVSLTFVSLSRPGAASNSRLLDCVDLRLPGAGGSRSRSGGDAPLREYSPAPVLR